MLHIYLFIHSMCGLGSYLHVVYMGRVGNEQLYEVLEKTKITNFFSNRKLQSILVFWDFSVV